PAAFGYSAVANGQAYDLAMATLAGIVSEGFSNYNRTKTGSVLAQGVPAQRHFKSNEFETYLQDAWRIKPNFTFTFGARYTLLQPPYETTGLQVAPTTSIHDWFNQRAQGMLQGQPYAPLLQSALMARRTTGVRIGRWITKTLPLALRLRGLRIQAVPDGSATCWAAAAKPQFAVDSVFTTITLARALSTRSTRTVRLA